ncbi:hypothetical protein [Haloarcula salinisoli]|uniref:Uncharacterized protein n=1 Tax=Haloarcula salinisoli TaxID=2487746 RepID=A0A8J8C7P0_9EURY|nr:hypothetical protein [Halomicroarcula salinisoli]MBX0284956.1 hypothetical protein [Halomicroarcula salinisoli]MBX0303566.1 hypothetical protein [Halomicroarcula salinisoli]
MATIELTTGDVRSHERIELRSGYVVAYEGGDGRHWGEIERVYPVSSVLEIDPGESKIQGGPQPGDGMSFVPE